MNIFDAILYTGQTIFVISMTFTNLRIYRRKSAEDFSIPAVFFTFTGMCCLLTYATHLKMSGGPSAMFWQNVVNVGYFFVHIYLVIKYRRRHG
jgi:uncharacterized protein with PQ loop repeat